MNGRRPWDEREEKKNRKVIQHQHRHQFDVYSKTHRAEENDRTHRECAREEMSFFFVFQLFFPLFLLLASLLFDYHPEKKWKNKTQFLMRLGPCVSSVCCLGLIGSPSSIVRWVDDDSQAQQSTTATRESWRPPSTLARCCCSIISTMRTISSSSRAPSAWRFCFGFFSGGISIR